MTSVDLQFRWRLEPVPSHGMGLSVDVYAPDLFELLEAVTQHGLAYTYLEVFKALRQALARVREQLPCTSLEYHGEGLWVTQPDWRRSYPSAQELDAARSTTSPHWGVTGST